MPPTVIAEPPIRHGRLSLLTQRASATTFDITTPKGELVGAARRRIGNEIERRHDMQ
ncbi:hypothetical protein [Burkholderia ubonensis]|uniref:hypothetical protein n=1 Tax=Burkholderia ubonensis TaxID=101571 RepID=UPI000B278EB9|nr:hypothetical protein [Burkholderia ubonensis]